MIKAIISMISTLVISLLVMAAFDQIPELGIVAAITVMGGFIIYFGESKK